MLLLTTSNILYEFNISQRINYIIRPIISFALLYEIEIHLYTDIRTGSISQTIMVPGESAQTALTTPEQTKNHKKFLNWVGVY